MTARLVNLSPAVETFLRYTREHDPGARGICRHSGHECDLHVLTLVRPFPHRYRRWSDTLAARAWAHATTWGGPHELALAFIWDVLNPAQRARLAHHVAQQDAIRVQIRQQNLRLHPDTVCGAMRTDGRSAVCLRDPHVTGWHDDYQGHTWDT